MSLLRISLATARAFTSCIPKTPTWSTTRLLKIPPQDCITPPELHHLLRLSALPIPDSHQEAALLDGLGRQLHFVQTIQACDTTGIQPLIHIRDETGEALHESTIGTEALSEELAAETRVGRFRRPRRHRGRPSDTHGNGVEPWNPLSTASKKSGSFFLVLGKDILDDGGAQPAETVDSPDSVTNGPDKI